ncbi:PAS-domain containing protein [Cognatishimia sp. F0-27]|uniref:PAS-domain containing protein n=1 Tax=Cognatishimia sp. F0-27 TaxID=2816855 RepID=UPI001D0CC0E7|nr:PAS-domain containing protein [Cognatishimia sp. F0-27]
MSLADKLAEERRARLAAERLLELKQAELHRANRKLGQHALQLSHEITETRAEVAVVREEKEKVVVQLGEATEKIQIVEGQLWQALETVRDGFAMFDDQGMMELANPAYLSIFEDVETIGPGATYEHVLEILAFEGIVDPQSETPRQWQERMLARWHQPSIPNEVIRLWNGRFIKVQDRRTPKGGVVTLAVDITGLMRMWSAVEEIPDGFVIFDSEDRLLMCNEPFREMYSTSEEALVPGTSFEDILRYSLERGQFPDAVGREEMWLEERMTAHRDAARELEQRLDDGRWLRVYERPTRDGGRVGLRVDITQIKEDQRRLQEAMIRAEEANRAKSAFLANMSHEIRTPMNGVVGMADLMQETDLTEDQRLYLDTIRSSGEALLVIINDILDYSKIEAEKLELHPEPFDLERSIHEVVMLLQPAARDKDLQLLVDFDMFMPTRFIGDPGRVRQILTNLMGNAVKFTNEGHVLVRVVGIPTAEDKTAIHITVEDTGIGIPADKVDHVFGEFNQVEDERNRKFEGTGLGLAISRKLVELMGGEVWVESELGQGSCFGMRLMLAAEEPVIVDSAELPSTLGRVIVVDHHAANRAILSKQLEMLGLSVEFSKTGWELIDKMTDPPDLLVIEQDLPDMQADELVSHLHRSGHHLPMILLSDNPGALQSRLETPVHAILQKPAPRRALFTALEQIQPVTAPETAAPALAAPEVTAPVPAGPEREPAATEADASTLGMVEPTAPAAPEPTKPAPAAPESAATAPALAAPGLASPEPATTNPAAPASSTAPRQPEPAAPHSVPSRPVSASVAAVDVAANAAADTTAQRPVTPPDTGAAPGQCAAGAVAPDKLDVLVAEDNKTNQLVFRKMAAGFDVELRFANNGIEAVQAYRDKRPDMIFMDISMPQMDGKQATREIRLLEGSGPHVPIIAVTAHAMSGDKEAVLGAGLDDYLTKPLRKSQLGEKIALFAEQIRRDLAS